MIQRVKVGGIQMPRLYLCETAADCRLAKENGLPYVRWRGSMDDFVKSLLRPAIEKLFPGINWDKVLGKRKLIRSMVTVAPKVIWEDVSPGLADYDAAEMLEAQHRYDDVEHEYDTEPDEDGEFVRPVDIAEGQRDCQQDLSYRGYDSFIEDRLSIYDYIGDISSQVDIEVLKQLKMLPEFVGEVTDIIRKNLSASMYWTEGFNKKLGVTLGNFKHRSVLPNLLIIDISWSIPDGIAATMLMLADTLRTECNAELIITSARSGYYPLGATLPKPQTLRNYYGRSNESAEFVAILDKYIAGREWGHVISFGDNDNPGMFSYFPTSERPDMTGTIVHEVHHFHTTTLKSTGYARWVKEVCPDVEQHYDTSWCKVVKKNCVF